MTADPDRPSTPETPLHAPQPPTSTPGGSGDAPGPGLDAAEAALVDSPPDWYDDGCSRDCREQHTYRWGYCALAAPPEPHVDILRVRDDMGDGHPGIATESLTVTELAERVEAALRTIPIRLGPNARAMLDCGEPVRLSGGEYGRLALAVAADLAGQWQAAMRPGEQHPAARALLAALDDQPSGYCPHCGRGDCAPTADQYAAIQHELKQAEAGEHVRQRLQSGTMPVRRVRLDDDPDPDVFRRRIADAARTVRLRLGPNALAMVQRGEPIPLSLGEADQVADAVLAVVQPHLDRLRGDLEHYEETVVGDLNEKNIELARCAGRALAALARVRAAVAERRAEVAEYEAEHPPSAWSDAVTVTCDRIDDALRPEVEPQGIHDTEGQPTTEETPAGPPA